MPSAKVSAIGGVKKPAPKKVPKKPATGRKVPRKRHYSSYSSFLYRVLKQVNPSVGITTRSMTIINSFINDAFERIAGEAARLARQNHRSTLTSREIQTAVRLVVPGELAKCAARQGTMALLKFNEAQ